MVEHLAPMPEWQFVDVIDGHAITDVEIAVAIPRSGIASVGGIAGVGLELFWSIVQAVRICVRCLERQACHRPCLETRLKPVVVTEPYGIGVLDQPKVRVWDQRRQLSGAIR